MIRILRHVLFVLITFAIVGGTTGQLAQSAQYATPMAPCKGMTPDCIKVMGCVTDVALPARLISHEFAAQFTTVNYWTAVSALADLVSTPEPLPPRTI
jgi:hypothetical protein